MYLLKARLRDSLYKSGLICLAISLFFFCLPFFTTIKGDHQFGLFIASFAMTLIYFLLVLFQTGKNSRMKTVSIILFYSSSYSW